MSWGITLSNIPVSEFVEKVGEAAANLSLTPDNEESRGTVAIAVAAAQHLVSSGIVGSGTISASVNGHINPGHVPTKGWANDFVSIVLTNVDKLEI
jgi:hypothetical protein